MKYIVFELNAKEMIFVFPREVDHDRMAEGCEAIRWGGEHNWRRSLRDGEPISAGFITNGVCHGRSETLGIESRGDADTALLRGAHVQVKAIEEPAPVVAAIERDESMDRDYIPLPGGWELQTKGKGSTLRLLDKKKGERFPLPLPDFVIEFIERMAREVHAAAGGAK